MAAAVADARQRVVLGEDGDDRRAGTGARSKCRRHLDDPALDVEAAGREILGEPRGRFVFAVGDFGIGLNAQAKLDQRIAVSVDRGASALFECGDVHRDRLA